MSKKDIVIEPFDPGCLSVNSYDLHLSPHVAWYDLSYGIDTPPVLDPKKDLPIKRHVIPKEGMTLRPNMLLLAATEEYTETKRHVPMVTGKSSVGRLGIFVHVTAGQGDAGFCNHWTLELVAVQPVIIYPGMPIAQITYYETKGDPEDYQKESSYSTVRDPYPQPSKLWKKFKTNG